MSELDEMLPGFDRVLAGITIEGRGLRPTALRQALIDNFPYNEGNKLLTVLKNVLEGRTWTWQSFDRWQMVFDDLGDRPIEWARLQSSPLALLDAALMHTAYSDRRWRRLGPYTPFVRGVHLSNERPEIAALEYRLFSRLIDGERELMPPFFPGSSMSFQFLNGRQVDQRRARGGLSVGALHDVPAWLFERI